MDDNATNRRILALQTGKWSTQTRDTASPAEALSWLQEGAQFDLAILDMHMPEMDGLDLARRLEIGGMAKDAGTVRTSLAALDAACDRTARALKVCCISKCPRWTGSRCWKRSRVTRPFVICRRS
jgi:CheY-like chemotaxis protein